MSCFVYYLRDPQDEDTLLYVGRSPRPDLRLREHERRLKRKFVFMALEEFATFEEASAREVEAIKLYRPPLNKIAISARGNLGKKYTPEETARARAAHTGFRHSDETKALISQITKGRPCPMKGKKHTPEVVEKIRQAGIGRVFSPEARAKIGAASRARGAGGYKGRRSHV